MKKTIKYITYSLLGLLVGIITLAFVVFNSNNFQNWITSKVTDYLSAQFKTKITIDHIKYYPFTGFSLDNVYWSDQKNDTLFFVDELRFNFGGFSDSKQLLTLNDVVVDGGYCKMVTYPDSTFNIDVLFNIFEPGDTIPDTISPPFSLYFNRVALKNSRFRLIDSTCEFEKEGFDGFNEDFYDINILAHHFWIVDDSLNFEIKKMSCNEKSGFVVNNIVGLGSIANSGMHFDEVDIKTPNSHIGHSFHMDYNGWEELSDFITKVKMTGIVEHSKVSLIDIAYFAPYLKGNNLEFLLDGQSSGTTEKLKLKNIQLYFQNSSFQGNVSLVGLPNIEETYIDIKATNALTNKTDLERLLLQDLPVELEQMGNMKFNGHYTGFYNDFVAYGQFSSQLGAGKLDMNMKLGDSVTVPSYKGALELTDFHIGQLTKQKEIGRTSFKASVDGKGLDLNNVKTSFGSQISYIEAHHYKYQHIKLNGLLNKKMFAGNFDMQDENAEVQFKGTIDLESEIPLYQFKAKIQYADLKALHFDTSHLVVSTDIDINFNFKNLDVNYGQLNIFNTLFIKDGKDYPLESIKLQTQLIGDQKEVNLTSELAKLSIKGAFTFETMASSFQNMGHIVLPEFIPLVNTNKLNQHFKLEFNMLESNKLTSLFFPKINLQGIQLNVSLNENEQEMNIEGEFDRIVYETYFLNHLSLNQSIKNNSGLIDLSIDEIGKGDSSIIKSIQLIASSSNNNLLSELTVWDTSSFVSGKLQTKSKFGKQTIQTVFDSSIFKIKNNPYFIAKNAILNVTPQSERIRINDLLIYNSKESITLNGFYEKDNEYNIKAVLKNINLKIINDLFNNIGIEIRGKTSGAIIASGDQSNDLVNSFLNIDQLILDKDTIGDFVLNSQFDEEKNRLLANIKSISGKLKDLECGGYIDLSQKPNPINFNVFFNESDLTSFQSFVKNDITLFYGKIAAKCKITGTLSDIKVEGYLNIMQVLARVEYLKTTYGLNSKILFDKNTIQLLPFFLNDVNGKQAKVEGKITHQSFSNFNLDIGLTEMNGFQVLNTKHNDNDLFYGEAYATGRMSLRGPTYDLVLDGTIKTSEGTIFNIPLSDSDDGVGDGLVNYVNKDTTLKSLSFKKTTHIDGFSMNILLSMTPDANIFLVFDEAKDDKIVGNGKGILKMELNKEGVFSMFGEVVIEKGEYKFTAIDVFTRKFLLKKGSTINWTGDPLQGKMNIQGIYKVRGTSVEPILTGASNEDKETAKIQRVPVDCLLNLKGNLLSPEITFDLNFPDLTGNIGSENLRLLENSLRKLRSEPEKMQEQVVSLMLFGRFAPDGGINQSSASGSVSNELANTLSDLISSSASALASNLIPGFNLTTEYQAATSNNQKQTLITTASKKFLNDRLEIQGSIDALDVANNNHIMGSYDIRPDGNLKARGYNRTSTNPIYKNNIITQGVGLYYRKEFDSFNEFLRKKNKSRNLSSNNYQ